MVSQCITSDYINTYDASLGAASPTLGLVRVPNPLAPVEASEAGSLASPTPAAKILLLDSHSSTADDEYGEKSVSVSLDGQEAEITFIDHPSNEMSVSYHCNHHAG